MDTNNDELRGEPYQRIYASVDTIDGIGYRLETLAKAFAMTGNMEVYNKLISHVEALEKATANIRKANQEATFDRFREAQQASANVLQAALAGVTIAQRPKPPELPIPSDGEMNT